MIDKRGFLLGAASAVAAPQVLATAGTCAAPAPQGLAAWQAQCGQTFALSDGHRHWAVRLQSAEPAACSARAAAMTEQFTLAFAPPDGARIGSGLHRLQAADGRSTLVQLDAAGSAGAPLLRAEFNLLRG